MTLPGPSWKRKKKKKRNKNTEGEGRGGAGGGARGSIRVFISNQTTRGRKKREQRGSVTHHRIDTCSFLNSFSSAVLARAPLLFRFGVYSREEIREEPLACSSPMA